MTMEIKLTNVSPRDAVLCGTVREVIIYQACKSKSPADALFQVCAPAKSIQAGQVPADSVLNFLLLIKTISRIKQLAQRGGSCALLSE